jgi:hypothetical protein
VLDGHVHVELVELRLLVYGDEVDIATASETVVRAGEEGVGVGGQVDARDGARSRCGRCARRWRLGGC